MAGQFTQIDLSQLAAPQVVEIIDFEVILAEMIADLQARDPTFTALVESDPTYKALEVAAFRETVLRQRCNDACTAVMLAYATGTDLDQLGANVDVPRLVITAADLTAVPPVAAVMELDTPYRARIQLSFEGYTSAGSEGSYVFNSLSADARIIDVQPISPSAGAVVVYVLCADGDGTAPQDVIDAVTTALSAQTVRPMTDFVTVQSAAIVDYEVTAVLQVRSGPDASTIVAAANAAAAVYAASVRKIGYDVALSGLYAALQQAGVKRVDMSDPAANVVIGDGQAGYCTAINITAVVATDG